MKIPITWLKDYIKTDKSPREIASSFTQLGLMLDKPLDKSGVLDLEHRMDRSDWLSILGCARDLAAFEKIKLIYPKTNATKLPRVKVEDIVEIKVETPLVRRFATRLVTGLTVGDSPSWLKERLEKYGIRSINNIVDITNYVMIEYGQPLHAQDLAKLKKREITIRQARSGEEIKTILGTTVPLDPSICVLSSGGIPTVITGIVGGLATSVTNTTLDIILDSGNYDQRIIRKTSRQIKIINETVSRCDKFLDPRLCEIALDRATYLLQEICGGKVYDNVDYYPNPTYSKEQTLTFARLATISGLQLPTSTIKSILSSLEYDITHEDKGSITVKIPYFRTDIEVEDDLIADILRINNYANIPVAPLTSAVPIDITPAILTFEDKLRDSLVAQGGHEHITTPLVKRDNNPNQVVLSNALSSDQNALRASLIPKLEEVVANYKKHKIDSALVFEIGKTFTHESDKFVEHRELTVVSTTNINNSLATLMQSLGITYFINNNFEILIGNTMCGSLTKSSYTLDTEILLNHSMSYSKIISQYSHSFSRDLSLLVAPNHSYADIITTLNSQKFTYDSVNCKSMTKIADVNNYLLALTWTDNNNIDQEVKEILKILKDNLGIDSKS